MYRTRVGYAGGTIENPTYKNIGDYMEAIQIDYNPQEVSYQELLKIFFAGHSPEYNVRVRQYMSAIFYHDEPQRQAAEQALAKEQKERNCKLYTQIVPYEKLYIAEAYHHKYYMQMVDVLKNDIKQYYPDFMGVINSTASARINGYVKGMGSMHRLMSEIDGLGLSEKGRKRLMEIVDSYE